MLFLEITDYSDQITFSCLRLTSNLSLRNEFKYNVTLLFSPTAATIQRKSGFWELVLVKGKCNDLRIYEVIAHP